MKTEVKSNAKLKVQQPMKFGIYAKTFKRPLDIILSLTALICLLPLFLIISIMVRYKLGSPILFVQERIGKGEKPFKMLKYRSMTMARDKDGNLLSDAERLTPFGKFLRSSSIDELPALWNVLKGEMSLIGPRPLPKVYSPYFTQEERIRHTVRGGLSGLAQVSGRNALTWEQRFAYDIEYVTNITFIGDLKIFYKTVTKVIKHTDIGIRTGPDDLDAIRKPQIQN